MNDPIDLLEQNVNSEMKDGKWIDQLEDSPQVKVYCKPDGDDKSVSYLIKKIRNIKEHYKDLKPKLKQELGDYPEGVYEFFSTRYPSLLTDVFHTIQKLHFPFA